MNTSAFNRLTISIEHITGMISILLVLTCFPPKCERDVLSVTNLVRYGISFLEFPQIMYVFLHCVPNRESDLIKKSSHVANVLESVTLQIYLLIFNIEIPFAAILRGSIKCQNHKQDRGIMYNRIKSRK